MNQQNKKNRLKEILSSHEFLIQTQIHNSIVIPRVVDSPVVVGKSVMVTVDAVVFPTIGIDIDAVPVVIVEISVVVWFT